MPTYCFLHLVHVMRYMSCNDMHEKECLTEYVVPVLVLLKVGLVLRCVHVVHLGFWQALMPELSQGLWQVGSFPAVVC